MTEFVDLCDAILGNSACLVKLLLTEEGADPNQRPKLALLSEVPKENGKVDAMERILAETDDYDLSCLHVAVVNCYHHGRLDGIANKQRQSALSILSSILDHGASARAQCRNILFCNIGGINVSSPSAPLDAMALALSLKKVRPDSVHADECVDMMDEVLDVLSKAWREQKRRPANLTTLPKTTVQTYKDLLFSPDFADVQLVCKDGTKIPAHCNILSAASPVFLSAFSKGTPPETYQTGNSPLVVKTVLTFIYTGTLDAQVLDTETAALLSMAAEFQLESLEEACASKLAERLTVQNVRVMLEIGERHKAKWIKQECLAYLQKHMAQALANPKFISMSVDNPALWTEVITHLKGGEGAVETNGDKK